MPNRESTGFSVPPAAIVNQIRTLLKERYKEGFPIIKEIIQNANDGGATRLDIGIIRGLKEGTHPLLREPALVFVNNGSFQDSDAQAIGWFGVDFNAGNAAKIGKFGLGQKSIFHFCEAFFYIAHSHKLSGSPERGRFLNPWADATNFDLPDAKHPDWRQLTDTDKEIVKAYLHSNELLNHQEYDEYFILWLPLRSPSLKDRCILPNHYDDQTIKEHLPRDMEDRIATLIPLLQSLRTVNYWLPDEENRLERVFQVHLDKCSQRFTYPQPEETVVSEMEHLLHGKVSLTDYSIEYTGYEVVLSANPFKVLLPSSTEDSLDFWDVLKESKFWPKRSTQDQSGEPKSIPDKAIPHCGIIISRHPAQYLSRLTVQWAVFLPLADENSASGEFEQIVGDEGWDYTILLHGYFFLDSGRRSIEALSDIYQDEIHPETPENDNQMVRLWNSLLATKGTLSLVIPALKEFCSRYSLLEQEVTNICNLLKQTKLLSQNSLQGFVYSQHYWVYRLRSNQKSWQLVDPALSILTIPSIPNWEAFPELSYIAETHCLILADLPNLIPSCKPDTWADSDIISVLNTLSINQIFRDETQLEFLKTWLYSTPLPLSKSTQTYLKKKLREALIQISYDQIPRQCFKNLVSLLDENYWFDCDFGHNELLKNLNQKPVNVLILPYTLAPCRQTAYQLTAQDAEVLISSLPQDNSNSDLIRQVVSAVYRDDLHQFIKQVNLKRFIPGINCKTSKNEFYSPHEIALFGKGKKLFLDSDKSRKTAADLQKALQEYTLVLVDRLFADKFCDQPTEECDEKACFAVLSQKPKLSDDKNRTNLLERLLP